MQLTPVLSAHWDEPDSFTIAGYERHEGYQALRSCLTRHPDELIQLVKDSGLRGRGGRRLPDRHEVGLHPAGRRQAALPGRQRRRVRAGHVQGHPVHDGQPARAGRGRRHRVVRDPLQPRVHLRPRRGGPRHPPGAGGRRPRPTPPATSARTSSAPATTSTSRCTPAPAPTSAARRPRCSTRSRACAASRGCARRSRPSPASTPARRWSTTSSRSRASRRSSATAPTGSRAWAPRSPPASRSTRCPATSPAPASTRPRSASPCASCSSSPAACARATS